MNPVLRAVVAGAFVALAVVGTAPDAGAADTPTAPPTAPPTSAAPSDRVVFTGTFVRSPTTVVEDGQTLRRYQVEVDLVYGEGDVARRVTVVSPVALERCRTGGQGGATGSGGAAQQEPSPPEPTGPANPSGPIEPQQEIDKQLRLFAATPEDGRFVVAGCDSAILATETALQRIEAEGREPGGTSGETGGGPTLDDVGFLCPDTRDAADLDDTASCEALAPGEDFARMAAPGLAVVIVGALGLVVARRLGRH